MSAKEAREVTEADFRIPELRHAKVEDYEFSGDGTLVRKDRWEQGIRRIVGLIEDFDDEATSDETSIRRRHFEIDDVVNRVEELLIRERDRKAAAESAIETEEPGADKR